MATKQKYLGNINWPMRSGKGAIFHGNEYVHSSINRFIFAGFANDERLFRRIDFFN